MQNNRCCGGSNQNTYVYLWRYICSVDDVKNTDLTSFSIYLFLTFILFNLGSLDNLDDEDIYKTNYHNLTI